MGGVQSGNHNLGEALWVHERQRQKCNREANRYDDQSSTTSTQDRRKLLKRTRSLAVISEDESKRERESCHLHLSESSFDLPRRHQLIPRAKLIHRNSLKDRLYKSQQHLSDSYDRFNETRSYYSRSTCGLHSIPPALSSLPDPLPCSRNNRVDPDRLNILDWPDPPRRYRSVQSLDTVSGLVDIVEDNWPIEGNRSIDCIYTQVKRKRKEHRSLDSILFEDDGELEYFDVLNLLPLSNVRLEFDEEQDSRSYGKKNLDEGSYGQRRAIECRQQSRTPENSAWGNVTDEEKCKGHSTKDDSDLTPEKSETSEKSENSENSENFENSEKSEKSDKFDSWGSESDESLRSFGKSNKGRYERYVRSTIGKIEKFETDVVSVAEEEGDRKVEEAEDYKSIWISDCEEQEDMSRRPQVLKVIDNDVTKRRHRQTSVDFQTAEEKVRNEEREEKERKKERKLNEEKENEGGRGKVSEKALQSKEDTSTMESARGFFERKAVVKETARNKQNEGRFERIVKETSTIFGKACSVVKGSLGFEARSESSDLGLGSESGSESRRRSVDDGVEEIDSDSRIIEKNLQDNPNEAKNAHSGLTRSRSCVDSIECQEEEQEFDHVRYKIMKSNVFGKNIYSTGRRDVTYDGVMQYLREYSFQELLLDNNVVIIEPVRAETIERKNSTAKRSDSSCKVAGAIQKKTESERNGEKCEEGGVKLGKQSSIRKHFFYHPIRVNRELIDEELPDPDTVKNVRRMFEGTLKMKDPAGESAEGCKERKSVSMKDLSRIDSERFEEVSEKAREGSRSRCSSRAKDLTRLFESLEKSPASAGSGTVGKDDLNSPRCESKARIIAQTFEARSGQTSPSDSNSSKTKSRYHHHTWDSGSVSSGVSSDYPDTDPGSNHHCTSSEDEEVDCQDDDGVDERGPGHFVSQDVLKKIRECGTSVTYYGGKVLNTYNCPLISPLIGNRHGSRRKLDVSSDYVKFRLVKSNSCDSRLELAGRLIERSKSRSREPENTDLRECTIVETPSIEITMLEKESVEEDRTLERRQEKRQEVQAKREPPVVIGLEPKKEDSRETKGFKPDFKLGTLEDSRVTFPNRFTPSALTRWQINETNWKPSPDDFGKMEFEEFEVLEDSLNANDTRAEAP